MKGLITCPNCGRHKDPWLFRRYAMAYNSWYEAAWCNDCGIRAEIARRGKRAKRTGNDPEKLEHEQFMHYGYYILDSKLVEYPQHVAIREATKARRRGNKKRVAYWENELDVLESERIEAEIEATAIELEELLK